MSPGMHCASPGGGWSGSGRRWHIPAHSHQQQQLRGAQLHAAPLAAGIPHLRVARGEGGVGSSGVEGGVGSSGVEGASCQTLCLLFKQ